VKKRILNLLIAFDQMIFSIITLGNAGPDETMSAAAWRLEQSGKLGGRVFRPIIDGIFFFDKDHCQKSYFAEINKTHLHKDYRINKQREI
jgi:hypothetical protein